ncbi:MAG: OmpA family protein [Croceitalea sp.]|nr:OmpA family protein [Croceitalea sp.]MBT8238050.1 OmpA family protein [Croceitalea sp.]NNC34606.1 OmpA family protein [Croceitalea sp.]NNL09516.1 OmpA family protein [Croceitalea sp.]NNM19198.1 OmpA family protein [Croceitalea sp.]
MSSFRQLLVLSISLLVTIGYSQDLQLTAKDSIVTSSWMFTVGTNIVDDAGDEFGGSLNVQDNWNAVPFPSRISIGRYFKNGLGLEAIGTYNRYRENKIIDGLVNPEDIDYFGLDFRVTYDLNLILGETGWFDPFVGVGAGFTDANNQGRGTYNAIIGFRTWLSDRIGLDFNSTGKWAMNIDKASNHIQHAVGVIYQFDAEKGLSPKGEEKLALLQEIEKEQQRLQDSIAVAEQAEREAKALEERLRKAEQAAQLAAEEKAKLEAKNARRNALQKQIKDLGNVYFNLNSSYLNQRDKLVLDQLAEIIEQNPDMILLVTSHTDSRGSEKYNLWLSERRVERTSQYLVTKGIKPERIKTKAFGESQLTNECDGSVYCTEEKHRQNRRSEFEILKL